MNHITEYVLYVVVTALPYSVFVYYPLRYFKRYNGYITFLIYILSVIADGVCFFTLFHYFPKDADFIQIILLLICLSFYIMTFHVSIGRILFNLFMIANVSCFVLVAGKYLQNIFFHEFIFYNFHWSYSLCMLIIELLVLFPVFHFIKHWSDHKIRDGSYDKIWRFSWILPLIFYLLGAFLFYHSRNFNTLTFPFKTEVVLFRGIIVVGQLLIYGYIANLVNQHEKLLNLKQSVYYQSLQKLQYKKLEKQIEDTRILRHDLRHHTSLICQYVDQERYNELKEYIHEYANTIDSIAQLHYTEHSVLNAILVYYADLCKSHHIDFQVQLLIPNNIPLSDIETSILFGNLLENAYDASKETTKNKRISIRGFYKNDTFWFTIENTFSNSIQVNASGHYISTKEHGSGIGTTSIKKIIEKYNGYLHIETQDCFVVSFSIPDIKKKTIMVFFTYIII